MAKDRILSLDGGGSWALIQVMALIDLFGGDATGHEVLREFDLAAANSGGSIVLGGLVENMPLATLLNFFLSEEKRKSVFVKKPHLPHTPKYKTEKKLKGLLTALPKRGGWMLHDAVAGATHGPQDLPAFADDVALEVEDDDLGALRAPVDADQVLALHRFLLLSLSFCSHPLAASVFKPSP